MRISIKHKNLGEARVGPAENVKCINESKDNNQSEIKSQERNAMPENSKHYGGKTERRLMRR
jgi:hypothetical protein